MITAGEPITRDEMAAALAAKAAKVDPLLLYRDFAEGLGEVLAVLAGGAEKYAAQGYRGRDPEIFEAALARHVQARWQGETIDPESGRPHLAHIIANALILDWHARNA